MGVLPIREALTKAEESGVDLVEVSPTANPPVCRMMDIGKFKYAQSKKEHTVKLHQKGTHIKEIKFRLCIGEHDLDFKVRHARDFLESSHKVKMTLIFRGREMTYQGKGLEMMTRIQDQLREVGQVEYPPKMEGNCMAMTLAPKSGKEHT